MKSQIIKYELDLCKLAPWPNSGSIRLQMWEVLVIWLLGINVTEELATSVFVVEETLF
jgi:hypothetical protein